jgi:hypothetical protein
VVRHCSPGSLNFRHEKARSLLGCRLVHFDVVFSWTWQLILLCANRFLNWLFPLNNTCSCVFADYLLGGSDFIISWTNFVVREPSKPNLV